MEQKLPEGVNSEYVKLVDGIYYDLCAYPSCKTNTSIRTDCPIEQRMYYVEGCGQLCEKHWLKTYSRA